MNAEEPNPSGPVPEVHGDTVSPASGEPAQTAVPEATPAAERVSIERPPPRSPWRNPVTVVLGVGFLVLVGALLWLSRNPPPAPGEANRAQQIAALQSQVAGLQQQTGALTAQTKGLGQQVTALAQRPVPQAPNLQPLEQRLAALEKRPAGPVQDAEARSAVQDLNGKVQSLAGQIQVIQRQTQAGQDVGRQLQDLAGQVKADEQSAAERLTTLQNQMQQTQSSLGSRIQELAQAQKSDAAGQADLRQNVQNVQQEVQKLQASMQSQMTAMQKAAGEVVSLTQRSARIARLQAAGMALDLGQPIGQIADAPPALAQFAAARPPTEAGLRLSFPAAAKAAEAAAAPSPADQSLGSRVWARVQQSVTVRQGEQVVVGNPVAGILEEARKDLDVGDLAGAVAAVEKLQGAPAKAMADWLGRAQALLNAREALAKLAAGA